MSETNTSNIPRDSEEELAQVANENPDLTITGWRYGGSRRHEENRSALFEAADQFRAAKEFLRVAERYTNAKDGNSYHMKHVAENLLRDDGRHRYIANGALIAAALAMGFTVQRIQNSPNCRINVHEAARK
jgi:hypothetical protein